MGLSVLLLVSILSLGFSQTSHVAGFNYESWKNCDDITYKRPDVFYVQGTAMQSLAPTVCYIQIGIEITNMDAAAALRQVRTNINNAISGLQKLLGKKSPTTYTTSQLSIQPSYESVYDKDTDSYNTVFLGYKVSHQLTIRSKNFAKLGSIIDTAIQNGLNNVQSVTFDFEPQERKQMEEDMIAIAVNDAKSRAQLALTDKYINYQITGIKYISIEQYVPPQPYYQQDMMMVSAESVPAPATQVFAGQQNIEFRANVGFLIEQK